MDKYDVSDPSDWLDTRLTEFAPLDASLRCEVCKDYYNTPMITSCSHTFCSLCIRRTLAADGKCPICRSNDQASKLRRNGAMELLVEMFQAARPVALKLAREQRYSPEIRPAATTSASKRKAAEADLEDDGAQRSGQRRKTRSQSRKTASSGTPDMVISDNEKDKDYQPEDNLVACPICNKRMKQEAVFPHLDHCEGEQEQDRRMGQRKRIPNSANPTQGGSTTQSSSKPPERISELSYGLLTEKALKKKLSELGIPAWGPRSLLIRRHTEWVNLWNANVDSSNPRSKRDLLHQLDKWERTQGGHVPNPASTSNGPNGFMKKDFDGAGWAQSNKSDFDRLIAEARRKPKKAENEQQEDNKPEANGGNTASNLPLRDKKFTLPETSNDVSRQPAPSSAPPPYLKHEDSLQRAKQKIHGTGGFGDLNSSPKSPEISRPPSKIRDSVHESRTNESSPEELFRAEERRASISSFSPTVTQGVEKIPMFRLQEHPIRDVDVEHSGQ